MAVYAHRVLFEFSQGCIENVNQKVCNGSILAEVYHDYIGYDKGVM